MSAWEAFCDASYFDMWCVREVGSRKFGEGFHLVNGDEARGLCELLNASVGRTPKGEDREDGLRAEHEHAVGSEADEMPKTTRPNNSRGQQ